MEAKFVRVDEQSWCDPKVYYEGNHRMQPSWLSDRYSWLDENGMPTGVPNEEMSKIMSTQVDQTYLCDENDTRELSIWKELLDDEMLTRAQVDEMKQEPHFSFLVQDFSFFLTLQQRSIRI